MSDEQLAQGHSVHHSSFLIHHFIGTTSAHDVVQLETIARATAGDSEARR
jgi:hypothetical protein